MEQKNCSGCRGEGGGGGKQGAERGREGGKMGNDKTWWAVRRSATTEEVRVAPPSWVYVYVNVYICMYIYVYVCTEYVCM